MITGKYIKDLIPKYPKELGVSYKEASLVEKAEYKCRRINFYLYKADYFTGEKKLCNLKGNIKGKVLNELHEFVIMEHTYTQPLKFSSTPFARRMRLMQ